MSLIVAGTVGGAYREPGSMAGGNVAVMLRYA